MEKLALRANMSGIFHGRFCRHQMDCPPILSNQLKVWRTAYIRISAYVLAAAKPPPRRRMEPGTVPAAEAKAARVKARTFLKMMNLLQSRRGAYWVSYSSFPAVFLLLFFILFFVMVLHSIVCRMLSFYFKKKYASVLTTGSNNLNSGLCGETLLYRLMEEGCM